MMMDAVIIEDENNNAERLERLIVTNCPDIVIKTIAKTVAEGIQAIKKFNPVLVFLDIELPDGTGFEIFEHFENPEFDVIFTTAFDQFAIKAIKFSASDYLLKPIDKEELIAAIKKVTQKNEFSDKSNRSKFFKDRNKSSKMDKIALPSSDGYKIVKLESIIRCEADGNYTLFILENKERVLVSKSLKEFEELLEDCDFCRVHHAHLINMKHAVKYHRGEGGSVTMSDNVSVDVSKRKKELFLKNLFKV